MMRQPLRLAAVALVIFVAVTLPSPAYSDSTLPLQQAVAAPLPQVSLPSVPVPEVSVPEPPDVPDLPDVPDVPDVPDAPDLPDAPDAPGGSVPSVSNPLQSSPQRSASGSTEEGATAGRSSKDGRAGKGATSANREQGATAIDSPVARPAIAQIEHLEARAVIAEDDYLLKLVHDELCTALSSLLDPMPETVTGLPPAVIAQLPPEVVNVVPRRVLASATVRCASEQSPASSGTDDDGPLTRVLGTLTHTGMFGAALPLGLALLSLGIGLRAVPSPSAGSNGGRREPHGSLLPDSGTKSAP